MTLAYLNFAEQAAVLERAGELIEAAVLWHRAQSATKGTNSYWAACRAEFCQKAAARQSK